MLIDPWARSEALVPPSQFSRRREAGATRASGSQLRLAETVRVARASRAAGWRLTRRCQFIIGFLCGLIFAGCVWITVNAFVTDWPQRGVWCQRTQSAQVDCAVMPNG